MVVRVSTIRHEKSSVDAPAPKSDSIHIVKTPAKTWVKYTWTRDFSRLARGIILADNKLFVAGPPRILDERKSFLSPQAADIRNAAAEQEAAGAGERERQFDSRVSVAHLAPPVPDGLPRQIVRQFPGLGRQHARHPGRFAHGHGIARHAVTPMGKEIATNAPARHEQTGHVLGQKSPERNIVGLHGGPHFLYFRGIALQCDGVNVH